MFFLQVRCFNLSSGNLSRSPRLRRWPDSTRSIQSMHGQESTIASEPLAITQAVAPSNKLMALDCITMSALDPSRLWLFDDRRLGRKEPNMMVIVVDYHP